MHLLFPKWFPLFILASSVCWSLQCLTQGGRWWSLFLGSLVQLCCGEGRTLQTNITGMCGECSQCQDHTGFAPAHSMCAFPVYIAQAPGCSAGEKFKVGPGFHVHFPGLSHSGSSSGVLHKGTDSVGPAFWACVLCPSQFWAAQATRCLASTYSPGAVHLITSPVPAARFPGCAAASQMCLVSPLGSWSLAATLLMDVNYPGFQEDLVSDWEPARSWWGDAISRAEFASFLLALVALACLPTSSKGWVSL